ncbi:DEK protein [Ancylostoma caninum]|uniref:DEK protein n=1 Tax=Ancylostoma caninum TaxID=29170 RepID=A0A368GRU1_ANCCA|nr:DEK protein [Ancylostoma caninum]
MALLQNTTDNIPAVDINPESEIIEKMESPTKAESESLTADGKDMEFTAMETEENADKKEEQVAEKAETDVSEEPAKEPSSAEESNAKEATPTKEEEKSSPAKASPKKSPVKKDNKKKENQENDEEAAEQEEDEHEAEMQEQKKGIFDMPLEVEGKRERHKVERISIGTPTVKKAPTEMKMGNGVPLGDIAYIEDQLKKHSANELQVIHRFIYGHVGKPTIIRREIRRFTGFAFEEDTPEFKHKVAYLQKLTIQQLNMMKKILGLHSGGNTKDALVTTIMVFMMKTVDHERKVPGKKRKSSAKTPTAKRSRKSKGSDEKKESETKETSPKTDSDSDSSEAAKKKTKKTTKKDSDDDTSSNSSADAPQENKPSEEELESVIEELLSTFDLAQVSMKQMCQAVIERFPGTNIGNRVDFLKSKIKQCLSTK